MKYIFNTPDFCTMAAEVQAVNGDKKTAKYLGIAPSTLKRYVRANHAPRAINMALFWITAAGKRELYNDLMTEMMLFRGLSRGLQQHNADLRSAIAKLEREMKHLSSIVRQHDNQSVAANDIFIYKYV